jgi:translation initiation factor 4E
MAAEVATISPDSDTSGNDTSQFHALKTKWVLWAHLPHDTDWSISSYKSIMVSEYVEEMLVIMNMLPDKLVRNCMLFLMREGVQPTWEDAANRSGGCFSYKFPNKNVPEVFTELCYAAAGETLTSVQAFNDAVTGITISPKKNFCIIKVWMRNCRHQDPSIIKPSSNFGQHGCIFKRHAPEY